MIGRTGFGPHHASDRTISRRCPAEIANGWRSDLLGENHQHPNMGKTSSMRLCTPLQRYSQMHRHFAKARRERHKPRPSETALRGISPWHKIDIAAFCFSIGRQQMRQQKKCLHQHNTLVSQLEGPSFKAAILQHVWVGSASCLPLTRLFERTRDVATFAGPTECATMHVVLLVTPIAVRRQRNFGNVLDNVAGVAIDAAVGSRQRITGLRIVIEAPSRPTTRVVAERTIYP
jgi:hypothetical protein